MGKILVTYASRTGCTHEAAEIIGDVLRAGAGVQVDVRPVQEASDLGGYDAVVVGSAGRRKRGWLREARHWLRDHEAALSKLPVAYFMTCWVLRDPTPQALAEARGYIELAQEMAPTVKPVDVGLFAGRLDLARFSAFDRFWLKMKHAPAGDWFDGEQVRRWAGGLPARMISHSQSQEAASMK
jgi:menaquinone-dependent protoporphyrinogen oxidase